MSDGEFHAYVGLLVFSGLLLSVLAGRGFGQSTRARIADGIFSAGFLGYAAYLIVAAPDSVEIFFYAFAAPVYATLHALRSLRSRRSRPKTTPPMAYAAAPAQIPSGYAPGALAGSAAPPAAAGSARGAYEAMPSGLGAPTPFLPAAPAAFLPPSPEAAAPSPEPAAAPSEARPATPSGLPGGSGPAPSGLPGRAQPTHAESRFAAQPPTIRPPTIQPPTMQAANEQSVREPLLNRPQPRIQPPSAPPSGLAAAWANAGSHRPAHADQDSPEAVHPPGYRPSHAADRHAAPPPQEPSGRHRTDNDPNPPAIWPPHQ
jgi:hypothetical protein